MQRSDVEEHGRPPTMTKPRSRDRGFFDFIVRAERQKATIYFAPAAGSFIGLFISSICWATFALSKFSGIFSSLFSSISSTLGRVDWTPPGGTSPLAVQMMALSTVLRK